MAIDNFKDIEERKGYLVEKEDRKIFEKEISKSNFGMGLSDMIEFVLYDSNDNQLPQGEDGKLVRYIHLNDKNINEYFIISKNTFNKKTSDAAEFIIDLEKLIREAGYSNGIFKTQVTLLNRRAGSEETSTDKMWIHEISPSRTEIRVVPLKNKNRPNKDLEKRYNLFTENKQFRDDTIYYVREFIENIDLQSVYENFIKSKGRVRDGIEYQNLVQTEFKVSSLEIMFQDIKSKYIEAMKYFVDGREYDINSGNYGNPKPIEDIIELSLSQIKSIAESTLRRCIEFYLPKRNIQYKTELTRDEQVTIDKVKRILKSVESNQKFESTVPDSISSIVRGCTDPNALNFNPNAKENDGSCKYKNSDLAPLPVKGCTDKSAINYNKYATKDDGSCKYREVIPEPDDLGVSYDISTGDVELNVDVIETIPDPPVEEKEFTLKTKIFYVWSERGKVKYKDRSGQTLFRNGVEFDALKLTYRDGSIEFKGDIREVPKIIKTRPRVIEYHVKNVSKQTMVRQRPRPYIRQENDFLREKNYRDRYASRELIDYKDSEVEVFKGNSLSFTYKDKLEKQKTSSVLEPGEAIILCALEDSISSVPGLKVTVRGGCGGTYPQLIEVPKPVEEEEVEEVVDDIIEIDLPPPPPKLCLDPKAINFRSAGKCRYPKPLPKPIDPKPIDNPIVTPPPRRRGGGGGGNREPAGLAESQFDIDVENINPFTNRGDFVNRTANNRNFR
jgi:hypothetical protein